MHTRAMLGLPGRLVQGVVLHTRAMLGLPGRLVHDVNLRPHAHTQTHACTHTHTHSRMHTCAHRNTLYEPTGESEDRIEKQIK